MAAEVALWDALLKGIRRILVNDALVSGSLTSPAENLHVVCVGASGALSDDGKTATITLPAPGSGPTGPTGPAGPTGSTGPTGATGPAGTPAPSLFQTIAFDEDDFASLGAGVTTFTKNIGDTTVGRVLLGAMRGSTIAFSNGLGAVYTLDVGWGINPDAYIDNMLVSAGLAAAPVPGNGTEHVLGFGPGALQLQATITSTADLNTTTAGYVEITITIL